MTDFCLKNYELMGEKPLKMWSHTFTKKCLNYANFLKQPLELGMFVPCVDGLLIERPEYYGFWLMDDTKDISKYHNHLECNQYQKAKERVLFEGFEYEKIYGRVRRLNSTEYCYLETDMTVESLIDDFTDITLTPNALKKIGL